MNENCLLTNRDGVFRKPTDGWYHLAPAGEFTHRPSGKVQVIDKDALESMVNRFNEQSQMPNFAGVLVDFDHFSYDSSKASEAAGWIMKMQNRADGLWAQIKLTAVGDQALQTGQYRFISPVWKQEDTTPLDAQGTRIRPLRLDSAGLTNQPNMTGMVPLSNRNQPQKMDDHKSQQKEMKMKSIMQMLGLDPEASEAAALAALQALFNRRAELETSLASAQKTATDNAAALLPVKNRVTELEGQVTTLAATVVEADLTKYANRFKPEARDKWKAQLIANRAGALDLLESLAEVIEKDPNGKPLLNRAAGKTPPSCGNTFPELVANRMATEKCNKSQAVDFAMANHREAHADWLRNGGGVI